MVVPISLPAGCTRATGQFIWLSPPILIYWTHLPPTHAFLHTASVPMVSQICVFVAKIMRDFLQEPYACLKSRHRSSALLHRQTPFLNVFVFSTVSGGSFYGLDIYVKMNFFDINLLCCSRKIESNLSLIINILQHVWRDVGGILTPTKGCVILGRKKPILFVWLYVCKVNISNESLSTSKQILIQ